MRKSALQHLPVLVFCVALAGCQQQMAEQPSYRPLQASAFFEDKRSARAPVAGTVARGQLQTDVHLYQGRRPWEPSDAAEIAGFVAGWGGNPWAALGRQILWSPYAETFPFPVTRAVLDLGRERFNIYCAVCHDRSGSGRGMIVRRGFTAPPSLAADDSRGFKLRGIQLKLREAPVGYFFDVITHGFGAMPDHAAQVPVPDRWAIIAYLRALQFSQNADLEDVRDPAAKERLERERGVTP